MKDPVFAEKARGGTVTHTPGGYKLAISAGDDKQYRLAQLDDYAQFARGAFPHRPALRLSLQARVSSEDLPGTWGFGLWNDPFGACLGFGGNPLRLPALPNAIWFFHASPQNHLSFCDNPGNGFLAQAFRAPARPLARLALAGLTFLFSRKVARNLLGRIVAEDGVRLDVDMTAWHDYQLEWGPEGSAFRVDGRLVLESRVAPHAPLGLVAWIDNQYAAFTPEGKLGFGLLKNAEPAWLEVRGVGVARMPAPTFR